MIDMSLVGKSARELLSLLQSRDVSSVEVVQSCLDQIEKYEPQFETLVSLDAETALERAAEIDRQRIAGESVGPLAGLPIAIKDNLTAKGSSVTCSSRMLEGFVAPYNAHVVERILDAGAVPLGRANMDEFAMGSSTESSAFHCTRNPWNPKRSPGGSSGGSAAVVAARMTPVAIGSDTGGSIRQPAAFCGIVGVKPTYGRVSRYGLVAFASSLDQIGPLSTNVTDAALLLEVLAGHDRRDATSVAREVPRYAETIEKPWPNLRIGIVEEHFGEGLDGDVAESVRAAIETYRKLGAEIVPIELPHTRYGVAAYYLIAPSEASSNLARFDGVHYGRRAEKFENLTEMYEQSRGEGFGDEVKRRIMLGTYALSSGYYDAYYLKALKVRRLIQRDFDAAFEKVDLILSPTTPSPAFEIGALSGDPLAMYLNDVYTIGANLAGIPGISIPCGLSQDQLPIGLQLLAPAFEEERLFRVARMYERETDWHHRVPVEC